MVSVVASGSKMPRLGTPLVNGRPLGMLRELTRESLGGARRAKRSVWKSGS